MRITWVSGATMVLLAAWRLDAQQPPPAPAPNPAERPAAAPARRARPEEPQFDAEAVRRGQELLVARCGTASASNWGSSWRSEEHTSELQSHLNLVCRLL